jgi:hypothetical protein
MQLGAFIASMQGLIRDRFADFPTCELYTGQFNPELDDTLSHKAPSLFTGVVSLTEAPVERALYDIDVNFATVLVLSTLNRYERDIAGWNYVEKLLVTLDNASCILNQSNVARVVNVVKTDRIASDPSKNYSNPGYSYWTVQWSISYRYDTVTPGEYNA